MNKHTKRRLFTFLVLTFSIMSAGIPSAHAMLDQWGIGTSSRSTLCDETSATCSLGVEPFMTNPDRDFIGSSGGGNTFFNNSMGLGWSASSITRSTNNFGLNRLRLRGAVYASDTGVVQTSARGVDGLTYTGTESMTLTITGELSGIISNDIGSGLTYLTAAMAVLLPAEVNALDTTDLDQYFGNGLAPLDFSSTTLLETGSTTLSVSLDLNPGDTFYLWSSLDLSAAAGGSALTTQHFSYVFSDSVQFASSSWAMLPIPGAVWMFGSAVVLLAAKSRRRSLPV